MSSCAPTRTSGPSKKSQTAWLSLKMAASPPASALTCLAFSRSLTKSLVRTRPPCARLFSLGQRQAHAFSAELELARRATNRGPVGSDSCPTFSALRSFAACRIACARPNPSPSLCRASLLTLLWSLCSLCVWRMQSTQPTTSSAIKPCRGWKSPSTRKLQALHLAHRFLARDLQLVAFLTSVCQRQKQHRPM